MNASALKLCAFGVASLLALPTGWCCGWFAPAESGESGGQRLCCQATQSAPAEDGLPNTAGLGRGCCCLQAPYLPGKSVVLDDVGPAASFLPPRVLAISSQAPAAALTAAALFNPGPRLHLLQCVWRC